MRTHLARYILNSIINASALGSAFAGSSGASVRQLHDLGIFQSVKPRGLSSKCASKGPTFIKKSDSYLAPDYTPLPVVVNRGKGVYVYDVDGREYLDFLAGYGTLAFGHCNPKLYRAVSSQMKNLTLSPRVFYSQCLANYAEYITQLFCYDKVLPAITGSEATETAVKIARKWGYKVKGICHNQAKIIFPENNYWGTSLAAISASNDPFMSKDSGPFLPGFDTVPFNNPDCLSEKLKDPNACAFIVEPIQSEAGVIVPDMSYLKKARDICSENNVLMIADEIDSGLGRAGSLLCCDIYQIRPDVLILGKALSGGITPVSAILADKEIMNVLEPGSHGSTFGGNPMSCRIAATALKILQCDRLVQNSKEMGLIFREELCDLPRDVITEVRGMGLLNAIVVHDEVDAGELAMELMKNGLLTQPAKNQVIRLTPPLTIKEKEVLKASQIIRKTVNAIRPQGRDKCAKCQRNVKGKKGKKRSSRKPAIDC